MLGGSRHDQSHAYFETPHLLRSWKALAFPNEPRPRFLTMMYWLT